jgi:hypothetical protein
MFDVQLLRGQAQADAENFGVYSVVEDAAAWLRCR